MVTYGEINQNQFLTKSTAEGLRVTILSTIELGQYLLGCGFHYFLSNKCNQDPIEVNSNIRGCFAYQLYLRQYKLVHGCNFKISEF